MSKVKFYDCYDYNDELLLIEMLVDENSEDIDFGEFVVPEKGLDENDWQCAYLEQYLIEDGTERICELYDEPQTPVKPCRFAFFLYKSEGQGKKLSTPYGNFSIESPKSMPKRLLDIIEFEDEEDEDDED